MKVGNAFFEQKEAKEAKNANTTFFLQKAAKDAKKMRMQVLTDGSKGVVLLLSFAVFAAFCSIAFAF